MNNSHRSRASAICAELVRAGIEYVAWLPDSETHFLHQPLSDNPDITLVQVCREGEAIATCAGLHLGGRRAALLIENQGLFDSGNVLKWAANTGFPILMLVGYLHFAKVTRRNGTTIIDGSPDYTTAFLDAFQIPHWLLNGDDDVHVVDAAARAAADSNRPAAVLVTSADDYHPGM